MKAQTDFHGTRIAVWAGAWLALLLCLAGCTGCRSVPKAEQAAATQPPAAQSPQPAPEMPASAPETPEPTESPAPADAQIPLVAFVPDFLHETLVRTETTIPQDTPGAILEELIRLEAVPDIDFGRNVYFEVGDSFVKEKGGKQKESHVARLDVSGRLLDALTEGTASEENLFLQAMANTFLVHYGAEVFMLTTDGDKLETGRRDYERGFSMDQYAKTVSD